MRRIFIIILILGLLLSAAIGGAWWYFQRTLAALPITDLDYRITALSYKHLRLEHISFTYLDEAQLPQANVAAHNLFVSWEWHGFRPELQIVEVGAVDAHLDHWPQSSSPDATAANWQSWQLPQDWRIQRLVPHRVQIDAFTLDLPCENRCAYSGSVYFSSDNKQRLIRLDDPQHTQLSLHVSPHRTFNEREQINLELNYTVDRETPSLDLLLHSPMALTLNWSQNLNRANRLRGELDVHYEPTAEWLVTHAAHWVPRVTLLAAPYLAILNDTFNLHTEYDLRLPGNSLARWVNEVDGEITLAAELNNQVHFDGRFGIQRNQAIEVNARVQSQFENAFIRNLTRQFAPERIASLAELHSDTPSSLTRAELTESPTLLFTQWQNPLKLTSFTRFQLPPGLTLADWPKQAVGRLDYTIEPVVHQIADLATFRSSSQGRIEFDNGIFNHLDITLQSEIMSHLSSPILADLNIDISQLDVELRVHQEEPSVDLSIPVTAKVSSQGASELQLAAQMQVNPSPFSVASDLVVLQMRQPEINFNQLNAQQLQLNFPFAFALDAEGAIELRSITPAQWFVSQLSWHQNAADSGADGMPDALIELEQLQGELSTWQFQGHLTDLTQSQLSASFDTTIHQVDAPMLRPVSWRHMADLRMTPFAQPLNVQLSGRLTNSPGLSVRHQAQLTDHELAVDWQLGDIFWLAGNPIAQTLNAWPELLQFDRGRTNASGTIVLPLIADAALQGTVNLAMNDVAGLYDTVTFNGLRADVQAEFDDASFAIEVDQALVQRIEAGVPMGPGQVSARYQGQLNAPLRGQLRIDDNQLNLLNGVVSLRSDVYHLDSESLLFYVDLSQLDIARLLAEYPAAELEGSGLLSGVIPIRWTSEGFFVDQGSLASHPPGGQIQYRSARIREMAQNNVILDVVMEALDDFHYSELSGVIGYQEDGKLSLGLVLQGNNPALENGRPIRLEVNIEEDLPALLTSLQLVNQLNEVIQERIQQRLIEHLRN